MTSRARAFFARELKRRELYLSPPRGVNRKTWRTLRESVVADVSVLSSQDVLKRSQNKQSSPQHGIRGQMPHAPGNSPQSRRVSQGCRASANWHGVRFCCRRSARAGNHSYVKRRYRRNATCRSPRCSRCWRWRPHCRFRHLQMSLQRHPLSPTTSKTLVRPKITKLSRDILIRRRRRRWRRRNNTQSSIAITQKQPNFRKAVRGSRRLPRSGIAEKCSGTI
jgi:hypothetical protein